MIAKDRICRTKDGEICSCDDPAAAFVLVTAGHEIPKEYISKVKAYFGDEPEPPEDDPSLGEPEDEPKAVAKPANKAVKKQANK